MLEKELLGGFFSVRGDYSDRVGVISVGNNDVLARGVKDFGSLFGDKIFGCVFVLIKIVFLDKIDCKLRVELTLNGDFRLANVCFGDLFGGNLEILIPEFMVFVRLGECYINKGTRLINCNQFKGTGQERPCGDETR